MILRFHSQIVPLKAKRIKIIKSEIVKLVMIVFFSNLKFTEY